MKGSGAMNKGTTGMGTSNGTTGTGVGPGSTANPPSEGKK
jgi:hypothetical protein